MSICEIKVLSAEGDLLHRLEIRESELGPGSRVVIERCGTADVLAVVPIGEEAVTKL